MEIRWLGHSAFEIITEEGLNILIDPFISNNPACQIPVEEFNPISYWLLTDIPIIWGCNGTVQ